MKRFFRTATVAVGIGMSAGLAGAQTSSAVPAEQSDRGGWNTIVYPVYGWAPVFGADVRLPEQPNAPGSGGGGGTTIPSAKTSGNFNGAAFGGFRVERRRLAVESNVLWAGMSGAVDVPHFQLHLSTTSVRVIGGVKVLPALYVEGGVRYLGLKMTAGVLAFQEVTWKPGIWEPVVGATFHPQLTRTIRLVAQADVGGLGSDSHRSSAAKAIIEWKPISHLLIGAGWGVLYVRADGTILTKPVHFQQTLNGPIVALAIPF
jgi:hypothetical protein